MFGAGERTGNQRARMRWSAKGYARHIVIRGGQVLKGWPTYAGVPFGNLSDVPGGQPVMELLLSLRTSGMPRFEDASEDDVDLAVANPTAVLPGEPVEYHEPPATCKRPRLASPEPDEVSCKRAITDFLQLIIQKAADRYIYRIIFGCDDNSTCSVQTFIFSSIVHMHARCYTGEYRHSATVGCSSSSETQTQRDASVQRERSTLTTYTILPSV